MICQSPGKNGPRCPVQGLPSKERSREQSIRARGELQQSCTPCPADFPGIHTVDARCALSLSVMLSDSRTERTRRTTRLLDATSSLDPYAECKTAFYTPSSPHYQRCQGLGITVKVNDLSVIACARHR